MSSTTAVLARSRTDLGPLRAFLVAAVLAGSLGSAGGAGSYATFNAQTISADNTFAAGSLVLAATRQGGAPCYSTPPGGKTDVNVADCGVLLQARAAGPGTTASANLALSNEGSVDASRLVLYVPSCTDGGPPPGPGAAAPCAVLRLQVQQWAPGGYSTPVRCVIGVASAADPRLCDPGFGLAGNALGAVAAAHGSPATGFDLAPGGLPSGGAVPVTVSVHVPETTGNSLQGRSARLDLNWQLS